MAQAKKTLDSVVAQFEPMKESTLAATLQRLDATTADAMARWTTAQDFGKVDLVVSQLLQQNKADAALLYVCKVRMSAPQLFSRIVHPRSMSHALCTWLNLSVALLEDPDAAVREHAALACYQCPSVGWAPSPPGHTGQHSASSCFVKPTRRATFLLSARVPCNHNSLALRSCTRPAPSVVTYHADARSTGGGCKEHPPPAQPA